MSQVPGLRFASWLPQENRKDPGLSIYVAKADTSHVEFPFNRAAELTSVPHAAGATRPLWWTQTRRKLPDACSFGNKQAVQGSSGPACSGLVP
jgi:hypothetical protein